MENIWVWLVIMDRISIHRLYSVHSIRQKYYESMIDSSGFCGMNPVIDLIASEDGDEIGPVKSGCVIDLFGSCVVGILKQKWVQRNPHFFLSCMDLVVRTAVPSILVESVLQYLTTCKTQQTESPSQWTTTFFPSLILSHLVMALSQGSEESLQQAVVSQAISRSLEMVTTDPSLITMELDIVCQILLSFQSLKFQEEWLENLLVIQSHLNQWTESCLLLGVMQLLVELCDDYQIR